MYALGSPGLNTTPPQMVSPLFRPPSLARPRPAQPERTHAKPERGGRMENAPCKCFFTERQPHQSRDRGTVCKRATLNFLVWQRARNDDSNKRLQPYLCRTHCPPQAGRGQPQLTTGPTPHIREKDQTRPFSKRWTATRPNKKTGKGGYHGVGGEGGGCSSPAS